jgi:hypothetical protein
VTSRTIRTESELAGWNRFLACQPLPFTVSYAKGIKRSLPQNATLHAWMGQIAAETGQAQAEVKAECKLWYGLPILERDSPAWVAKWQPLYGPLAYAQRLALFEVLPVTSVMTTRQMGELMDAIQKEYRAQGISLIDPENRRYEAEFGAGS